MKKVCIVTTDVILGYQPTVLNLYDNLAKHFNTEIISFAPRYISSQKVDDRKVIYLPENGFRQKVNESIDFCMGLAGKYIKQQWIQKFRNNYFQRKFISRILEKWLISYEADEYIAVDFMALYTFQKARPAGRCHFVSLEILEADHYRDNCDFNRIISVIIQSKERYEWLFGNLDKKIFYIQNAPDSASFCFNPVKTGSLLWGGSILIQFGVLSCINFIDKANEYTLTLKGGAQKKTLAVIRQQYGHLLESGKLIIDTSYHNNREFIGYLSKFLIGFCFYDIALAKNNFNYRTAPAGKLFAYYAASVPVIALNIPGLQSVKEFNAGVLIDDYSYASINNAIEQIKLNYDDYAEGCKRAAIHFAFDKHCSLFINFLEERKQ